MNRKQLIALFICNLTPFFVGNSLLGLLPVYATRLGASESVAGIYLGLSFASLVVGTLFSGWLSDRFQRRKQTIIIVALIGFPAGWLMGQVSTVMLLTVFTVVVWFVGGVVTGTVNILTGMYADSSRRGLTFGIVGAAGGLSQILGGLSSGYIVDRWGFVMLFTLVAFTWLIPSIAGLFLDDRALNQQVSTKSIPIDSVASNTALWLLIIAAMLAGIPGFSTGLGRPLLMDMLKFDASAITSTIAVGGLVGLPAPFLLGWLSDRIGRRQILIVSYCIASIGAFILIGSIHLWQFWFSVALFSISGGAMSIGSALIADLVPEKMLSLSLTRYASSLWIAGTLGFSITGFIIQSLGMQMMFILTGLLPLIAIPMIIALRTTSTPQIITEQPMP